MYTQASCCNWDKSKAGLHLNASFVGFFSNADQEQWDLYESTFGTFALAAPKRDRIRRIETEEFVKLVLNQLNCSRKE